MQYYHRFQELEEFDDNVPPVQVSRYRGGKT